MIIDAHMHPLFFAEPCDSEQKLLDRKEQQAYYKMGVQQTARVIEQNRIYGVDRVILLPYDFRSYGLDRISNDDMASLVQHYPDAFYGFATVNPNCNDAESEIKRAFTELKLSGLKLHPAKQHISPTDPKMMKLYEFCQEFNKPIVFHVGLGALSEYCMPERFEPVAVEFPRLRFSLAYFAFPWIAETAALLAKYPNIYADLGLLYYDSTDEFFSFVFGRMIDSTWVDRGIRHQVLFGTNSPRWGSKRAIRAIRSMPLREDTINCIFGKIQKNF